MKSGKRNLILLGVGSVLIALITTGISLFVYDVSGDIYLDRSRPDFLPDQAEAVSTPAANETYKFSDSGPLTKSDLMDFNSQLQKEIDRLNQVKDPFGEAPLSDAALNITGQTHSTPTDDTNPADLNQDANHIHD